MKTELRIKHKKEIKEANKKPFNFVIKNEQEKQRLIHFFLILESVDNKLKKQQTHL